MRPNRVVGTVVGMVVEKVGQVTILLRSLLAILQSGAVQGDGLAVARGYQGRAGQGRPRLSSA